ncbi:unnamed protein product [Caenorhabditis bovis]|uniref:Glutathione peroxidase n=1 Tax=Caenorhabditis bovis TaxID=2654633 RepID=A0A8S1FCA8_9PELO|nr:unnamed protein product [Caenorhabditis bovis]
MLRINFASICFVLLFATIAALPFFNSPNNPSRGEQYQQFYYSDFQPETPENARYVLSRKGDDELKHHNTIYAFSANTADGKLVTMEKYRGHVVIFVNVASYCGYTESNYEELKKLQNRYYEKGLRVAAFPCNQFGQQEPDEVSRIKSFVNNIYDFEPDLYEKIDVNGPNAHPLWKFLKAERGSAVSEDIPWNFSKFLVDKNGHVVGRYSHAVSPMSFEKEIIQLLE